MRALGVCKAGQGKPRCRSGDVSGLLKARSPQPAIRSLVSLQKQEQIKGSKNGSIARFDGLCCYRNGSEIGDGFRAWAAAGLAGNAVAGFGCVKGMLQAGSRQCCFGGRSPATEIAVRNLHQHPQPESRIPNPESRIPNPESRIPNPAIRGLKPGFTAKTGANKRP